MSQNFILVSHYIFGEHAVGKKKRFIFLWVGVYCLPKALFLVSFLLLVLCETVGLARDNQQYPSCIYGYMEICIYGNVGVLEHRIKSLLLIQMMLNSAGSILISLYSIYSFLFRIYVTSLPSRTFGQILSTTSKTRLVIIKASDIIC